jgi:PHD/YefM family antitoxin component YafN of YafNO toxin-antitoxin module
MNVTLHELASAVEAGVAYVVLTGDSVAAAAAMAADNFELDALEREVCERAIQQKLAEVVHER